MNRVRGIGPLYWITRDFVDNRTPIICTGFMRETGAPWRQGKGLQIRTKKHTFQIGFCKRLNPSDETAGILGAVGGRMLDLEADEIGSW